MKHKPAKQHLQNNACARCLHAPICLLSSPQKMQSTTLDYLQFSSKILKRGEHLCYQGEQSHDLYIIRTGLLKSTITKRNGESYIMGFYFPPDLFGWEGIDETHRAIAIEAVDHTNVCVIPVEKMFLLTQAMPALGTQLLKMIGRRIHQDNIALLRTSAYQRVATFLLQIASRYHVTGLTKNYLPLPMTHQDIANYLRITPSTMSRIFHAWQQKKIIRLEKHGVQLLNIAELTLMGEYA